MSNDSKRNAAVNAAAGTRVHHVTWENIKEFTPEKVDHFRRGGIRTGPGRTEADVQQLIDYIPASRRSGVDGQSAAQHTKDYLSNKDASHINPHSQGGSSHPDNIRWEDSDTNRYVRGDKPMTQQELANLENQAFIDNVAGAVEAGVAAAPRGAVIGAVTTLPFSMLRNGLKIVRGEITAQEAAMDVGKETLVGSGVGAVSAFGITAIASACPPIALALTAISPVLLAAGGAGMAYEFYKILDDHKKEVRDYYASLTEQQMGYLQQVEDELVYEHQKAMARLDEAQAMADEITDRPREAGVEGALKRFMESRQLAQSRQGALRGQPALEAPVRQSLPPAVES
jgi:hypothetical protein